MKIITTIFFLLFAFITSALGAEKNLICGGSKEDVMGARIYIKLIKQIDDNYGVVLERTTLKSKASINKKILENLKWYGSHGIVSDAELIDLKNRVLMVAFDSDSEVIH